MYKHFLLIKNKECTNRERYKLLCIVKTKKKYFNSRLAQRRNKLFIHLNENVFFLFLLLILITSVKRQKFVISVSTFYNDLLTNILDKKFCLIFVFFFFLLFSTKMVCTKFVLYIWQLIFKLKKKNKYCLAMFYRDHKVHDWIWFFCFFLFNGIYEYTIF